MSLAAISVLAVLPDYNSLPPLVSISDLLNHFVAFVALTLLYTLSYAHTRERIAFSLVLYAITIEVVQVFLPTRFASLSDILADSLGILLVLILIKFIPLKFLPLSTIGILEEDSL